MVSKTRQQNYIKQQNYSKKNLGQCFQVKYKRLVLKYFNPILNKTMTWNYGIQDTEGSPRWFEPPSVKSFMSRKASGYQDY